MAMEVTTLPLPLMDFNFDSNCSSPYITAPSSPQRFPTLFLTAPPSPSSSTSRNNTNQDNFHFLDYDDHDFQFDFSGHLDHTPSLSAADELFHGGKILPLKPPSGNYNSSSAVSSPRRSPRSRTRTEPNNNQEQDQEYQEQERKQRGRERNISNSSKPPNYVHKGSRSLSPFRVSDLILDDQDQEEDDHKTINAETTTSTTTTPKRSSFFSAISFSSKGYKKWKLKDLLLFRSASEGRAVIGNKDQYTVLSKRSSDVMAEDVKNSSFRSTDSSGGVGSSSRRIGGRVSAHELHYTANRAVAEEMKRKTNLPYKHGLLGCLGGFNNHDISKSIGSLTRG